MENHSRWLGVRPAQGSAMSRQPPPAGTPKYKARGVRYDDRFFASIAECDRYKVLKDRQRKGIIAGLQCQTRFRIRENRDNEKEKPFCTYVADFEYFSDGAVVVEDVKGYTRPGTPVYSLYKLKRTLVRIWFGVHVREIKKTRHGWTVDGEPEGVIE